MASSAEQCVSRSLRTVLAEQPGGACIGDSEPLRAALKGLEIFLTEVLAEIDPDWQYESLDGIIPFMTRKTGADEAEIFGLAILISDQTQTALHLRIQLAAAAEEITWLQCRLGEKGPEGMMRSPYDPWNAFGRRLYGLIVNAERIEWVYKVSFGERRA